MGPYDVVRRAHVPAGWQVTQGQGWACALRDHLSSLRRHSLPSVLKEGAAAIEIVRAREQHL